MKTMVLLTSLAMLAMAMPAEAGVEGDPASCAGFVTDGDYLLIYDPESTPGVGCGSDDNGCDGFQDTEEEAEAAGCDDVDTTNFSATIP